MHLAADPVREEVGADGGRERGGRPGAREVLVELCEGGGASRVGKTRRGSHAPEEPGIGEVPGEAPGSPNRLFTNSDGSSKSGNQFIYVMSQPGRVWRSNMLLTETLSIWTSIPIASRPRRRTWAWSTQAGSLHVSRTARRRPPMPASRRARAISGPLTE